MMNKNISNRPFPIKICYLKDDNKIVQPEKVDKVSVTFLSSFIQQEKADGNPGEYPQKQQNLNTTTNHNFTSKKKTGAEGELSSYGKWAKNKVKCSSEDKRYLRNLIGDNWQASSSSAYMIAPFTSKAKRNKSSINRVHSIEDEERKQKNNELMKTHFNTFLSNKRTINEQNREAYEPKCSTNKVDERHQLKNTYDFALFDKSLNFRQRPIQVFRNLHKIPKPKTSQGKTKNQRIFDCVAARVGFQQVPNFQWSKLQRNIKFRLNDSS